jgi:arsenate reductase
MAVGGRLRVLFLCTANSARSQIAEGLLRARGGARVDVGSAGTRPAGVVNPYALEVLRESGVDVGAARPKLVDDVMAEGWDVVITVCDAARDVCPVFPGPAIRAHWGVADPAAEAGDAEEKRRAFRAAARVLGHRIDRMLALPLESLTAAGLAEQLERIGESEPVPAPTAL